MQFLNKSLIMTSALGTRVDNLGTRVDNLCFHHANWTLGTSQQETDHLQ